MSAVPAIAQRLPELFDLLSNKLQVDELAAKLGEKPARNTLAMLGLCAVAFYVAEKDHNNKVDDLWDALEYCSSSLSVGYTDVYPQTPLGKIVASLLMTFGPSMVSRVTTGGAAEAAPDLKQEEILATLRAILAELKSRPAV
jgi:hypothetical protein